MEKLFFSFKYAKDGNAIIASLIWNEVGSVWKGIHVHLSQFMLLFYNHIYLYPKKQHGPWTRSKNLIIHVAQMQTI